MIEQIVLAIVGIGLLAAVVLSDLLRGARPRRSESPYDDEE